MKYLLFGDDDKLLFVEDDDGFSIFYSPKIGLWYPGGTMLNDARVGFDPSEPEDSPYRYGNTSCMEEIVEITHEQAEVFLKEKFTEEQMIKLLKQIRKMVSKPIYD